MNREASVWILAFVTFVIGDLVTTAVGLHVGLVESHPIYDSHRQEDLFLLALCVKALLMFFFVALYRFVPDSMRIGIPVGLSVLGIAVTGWNAYLILSVA